MASRPEFVGDFPPMHQELALQESNHLQHVFNYYRDIGRNALVRGVLALGLAAGAGAATGIASEMAEPNPPAAAANGGYPHADAKCLANGQTSGTGNWCSNYDWWVDENGNSTYNALESFIALAAILIVTVRTGRHLGRNS